MRPQTLFDERDWRRLLRDIEDRRVVPIVGPELVTAVRDGTATTLNTYVAKQLLVKLALDEQRLPADYDLLDVTSLFLQDPSHDPEELHFEVREIVSSLDWPIPDPLLQLGEITDFDLFVSTTCDDLLERALNQVRFRGAKKTTTIAYSKQSEVRDIPAADAIRPVTIFRLFGGFNATGDYAITEEDLLEFSHRLQSRDLRPHNLFDVLRTKNLLTLGCNFPGWLGRFLLRAAKGEQLYTHGARGVFADQQSSRDDRFAMFLERRKASVYAAGDATQFVSELYRRWKDHRKAGEITGPRPPHEPEEFRKDSIFISYASEDRAIAEKVCQAFDRVGVDAWLDRNELRAGDDYRRKIERFIETCSGFVALISKHSATQERRFFHLEWNKAIDESKFRPAGYPFLQPLLIDDVPLDAEGIPPEFGARHCRRIHELEALAEDAKVRLRRSRKEQRLA